MTITIMGNTKHLCVSAHPPAPLSVQVQERQEAEGASSAHCGRPIVRLSQGGRHPTDCVNRQKETELIAEMTEILFN